MSSQRYYNPHIWLSYNGIKCFKIIHSFHLMKSLCYKSSLVSSNVTIEMSFNIISLTSNSLLVGREKIKCSSSLFKQNIKLISNSELPLINTIEHVCIEWMLVIMSEDIIVKRGKVQDCSVKLDVSGVFTTTLMCYRQWLTISLPLYALVWRLGRSLVRWTLQPVSVSHTCEIVRQWIWWSSCGSHCY